MNNCFQFARMLCLLVRFLSYTLVENVVEIASTPIVGMTLQTIMNGIKQHQAQQRESEADKLVKDTMIALQKWDKRTEELVSQLQKARDEHVSTKSMRMITPMVLT